MAFVFLFIIGASIWGAVKFVLHAHHKGLLKTSQTAAGWLAVGAGFAAAILAILLLAQLHALFG